MLHRQSVSKFLQKPAGLAHHSWIFLNNVFFTHGAPWSILESNVQSCISGPIKYTCNRGTVLKELNQSFPQRVIYSVLTATVWNLQIKLKEENVESGLFAVCYHRETTWTWIFIILSLWNQCRFQKAYTKSGFVSRRQQRKLKKFVITVI